MYLGNIVIMEWKDFEENVRDVLELEEDVVLTPELELENTDFWSSMHALLIMALGESEYGISISGEDLRSSKTLGGLFDLFKSKMA